MALTIESFSTNTGAASTSIIANKPTGTVDGDLLVTAIQFSNAYGVTTLAGWTRIATPGQSPNGLYIYWKIASGEGSSWTWTASNSACKWAVAVYRISGHNPTTPIMGVTSKNNGSSSTTVAFTDIPAAVDDSLVLLFSSGNYSGSSTITPPTNFTEDFDFVGNNSTEFCLSGSHRFVPASGNYPAASATQSQSATSCTATVIIWPADHGVQTYSSANAGGGTSLVINKPTGTVDGDLLVAAIQLTATANSISSAPSGWTAEGNDGNPSSGVRLYIYTKIASSEPSSWTWTLSATDAQGVVMRMSGAPSSSYLDTSIFTKENSGSATSITHAAITTTAADDMLLLITARGASGTNTPPSGWYELYDTALGSTGLEIALGSQETAGSTGTKAVSFSSSGRAVGWFGAIKKSIGAPAATISPFHLLLCFP